MPRRAEASMEEFVRKLSEAQIWLVDYCRERWPASCIDAEYQFHGQRKWRFDVAVFGPIGHDKKAFEIEGGLYVRGAHVRGQHYESDMEKYNTAAAHGWKVFRFTPEQILGGKVKEVCEREGL